MRKLDSVLLLGAMALAGCSGAQPGNSDDLGEVTLAITNAPADASCLRVNVTGSRAVTRLLDLMPGQSTVFTLTGLPLGNDTFQEDAFSLACNQVTSSSIATWSSDPTTATLQAGVATNLTIVLHRNGTAIVSSDFQDDPTACVPAGGPCMVASSCCNGNSCVSGVCTSAACLPPQQLCMTPMGSACVDVSNNVNNCGACGVVCGGTNGSPTCAMGVCGLTCNPGFSNCDGNFANGCEANLQIDPNNCGACGNVCPLNGGMAVCQNAMCNSTLPPQIQVPPQLNFPTVPLGSSTTLPLQIGNTGGSVLLVNGTMISGPNAPSFHSFPPPPFNVPPGGSFQLNVTFNPTMPSPLFQAFIVIQSNDPMRPSVQVQLNGSSM
jgi:hypothetical protein